MSFLTKKTPENVINQMLEMAKDGIPYKEIAEKFGTNKDMVSRILTREGFSALRNKKKSPLNVEAIKYLIEEKGYSVLKAAKELGISATAATAICSENNIITNKKNLENRKGKKYEWTKEKNDKLIEMYASNEYSVIDVILHFGIGYGTLHKKTSELGIKKVRSKFITKGEKEFFSENHDKMTVEEMAKIFRISAYTISQKLFYLGYVDTLPSNPSRSGMPNSKEFLDDYHNPYISHSAIAMKYQLKASQVGAWRRKDFGKDFLISKSPSNFTTSIESAVKQLLLNLDIAYLPQHKIGDYTADFYLGNRMIIECDGSYWHTYKEKTIEKDKRKKSFFASNGYKVLHLTDEEINNHADQTSEKIYNFYLNNLRPLLSKPE